MALGQLVHEVWAHPLLAVVAGVLVLAVLGTVAVLLLPHSRRWARLNRLHRLASRNERALRRGACEPLDKALRALEAARRRCIAQHQAEGIVQLEQLLDRVKLIRDQVASAYGVSPANSDRHVDPAALERFDAAERFSELCVEMARRSGRGRAMELGGFREATEAAIRLEEGVPLS